METTHIAPVIYLPEKLLRKAILLINPNCGKRRHKICLSAFCRHKINFNLKWSSKSKLNKIKLLPFNGAWLFCYLQTITHEPVYTLAENILHKKAFVTHCEERYWVINSFNESFKCLLGESLRG